MVLPYYSYKFCSPCSSTVDYTYIMKYKCYITNGCSFSGKSTWALRNFAPQFIIESDIHKYDKERNNADLITYLSTLVLSLDHDCVLVQTNNSFSTFKKYYDLLHNKFDLVIVNFDLTEEELINLRTSSNRATKKLKKVDRLSWYIGIMNNSLEQIRTSELWTCIEYKPQISSNSLTDFLT